MQALGWGCLIAGYSTDTFWLLSCAAVSFSASLSFAHRSVRTFMGMDSRQPWLYVAPLCIAVLHPAAQYLATPHLRIGVTALAGCLQASGIVLSIWRGSRGSTDGWKWLVMITMSCTAAFSLLKVLAIAFSADPTLASTDAMNILGLVIASVSINLNSLSLLLAQRTHAQRELEVLATTDALTGLANRGSLIAAGERAFADAMQRGSCLTVVMIDLDLFKSINDTYGHLVGDEVLVKVAALLRQSVRRPDIVGRFGGEEFCILMPGSGTEAALSIDRRLRNALEETAFSRPGLKPDFSAGAAESTRSDASFNALLGRADALLYAAKQTGRGHLVVATKTPSWPMGNLRPLPD